MNTTQINHALRNVHSFGGVYPSDLLPNRVTNKPKSYIINLDPHSSPGSHWVAVYFKNQNFAYYFDSFGLPPLIPGITKFIIQNSINWSYNTKRLQGLTSSVCGQYTCLFTYYMDRGRTMQEFVNLFNTTTSPDKEAVQLFHKSWGSLCGRKGGQRCLPGHSHRESLLLTVSCFATISSTVRSHDTNTVTLSIFRIIRDEFKV